MGRAGEARPDRLPRRSTATRRSTRSPTARSTSWTSAPTPTSINRAKGIDGVEIRVAGGPNFRHMTINGTSPILQDVQRAPGARDGDRSRRDRAGAARPARHRAAAAQQPHLHGQSGGLPGQLGRRRHVRSGEGRGSCSTRPAGSSTAACGTKDGQPLEITLRDSERPSRPRGRRSELMQNMLGADRREAEDRHRPDAPTSSTSTSRPGQFDFTVFSWIGTPFPISSSKSIYAKPTTERRRASWTSSRTTRASAPTRSTRSSTQANRELDRDEGHRARQSDRRADLAGSALADALPAARSSSPCKKGLANFGAFGFAQPGCTRTSAGRIDSGANALSSRAPALEDPPQFHVGNHA